MMFDEPVWFQLHHTRGMSVIDLDLRYGKSGRQ